MRATKLTVNGVEISLLRTHDADYISLTDMVRNFGDDAMIYSWMRNRNTLEFLGLWEEMHNPGFKGNEFVTFRAQAGLNSFNLTPRKWIESTKAVGIVSKAGRYGGGTFAHSDIAFEFGSWLNPAFKLYLLKEFQRLKADEQKRLSLDWQLHRTLAKVNYRIHTDAIKEKIVPAPVSRAQASAVYASEADLLNVALFGRTAKQWREENPDLDGNIRDHAELEQLVVLSNLESINALLIHRGLNQSERLVQLNETAISQSKSLAGNENIRLLK